MNTRSQPSKLVELRAKTDRQLVEIISSELNAGLTYARLAGDPETRKRWASTEVFREKAAKASAEVRALLWVVNGVSRADRRALELKLALLDRMLQTAAGENVIPARAACF
jgi:hypothetical protein